MGRAGEEGAQDACDAGQAGCMAADPGPLIPNRGLREGADARAVVAEQLEVEGVGNFIFTSTWDLGDPFQEGAWAYSPYLPLENKSNPPVAGQTAPGGRGCQTAPAEHAAGRDARRHAAGHEGGPGPGATGHPP